jgi:hypothetical protein
MLEMGTREEVQKGLGEQLRAALGDSRYAELTRATSEEYRQMTRLVEQQSLPPDTANRGFALALQTAERSQQIAADATLTPQQQRAAIKDLAQNARADLAVMFPGDAGQTVIKRQTWLSMLDHGVPIQAAPVPPLVIATDSGSSFMSTGAYFHAAPHRRVNP